MRKPVLLIFANAAILIVLFSMMTQSLFIVARLASAKSVTGQVEVRHAGENAFHPLHVGEAVKAGDEVQSAEDGRAEFAWPDGTRWKIEPQTRLTIERALLNSRSKTEHTQLRLDAGKVWVRVVKTLASGSGFGIETPTALAKVRGTVWSIEVSGDQTRVGVYKGFVEVTGDKTTEIVRPGLEAIAGTEGVKLERARNQSGFGANPDLLRPLLDVQFSLGKVAAIVNGRTEAGDLLTLNGEAIPLLNNGAFLTSVPFKNGHNEWTFSATDKHGVTSSVCRAVEFDGKTARLSACR